MTTHKKFFSTLLIAILLAVSLAPAHGIQAQATILTFLVNDFADVADHTINGECSAGSATGGPCTLRAATMEASHQAVGQSVIIQLPAGTYPLTIPPDPNNSKQTGDLDLGEPYGDRLIFITAADLSGDYPLIDGSAIRDGIFNLQTTARIIMTHLALTGGVVESTTSSPRSGGAIHNEGSVELNDVLILGNSSICDSGYPGCSPRGGAIANYGRLEINDSLIYLNEGDLGSAIYSQGWGGMHLNRTQIFSNITHTSAVHIEENPGVNIVNSVISNNASPYGYTYGLRVACCADVTITASTFVHLGQGYSIFLGRIGAPQPVNITISDTILYSEDQNCLSTYGATWSGVGYNIDNNGTCADLTGLGNLLNTDPMLAMKPTLFGFDPTHKPLPGSPAVNHRSSPCTDLGSPLLVDQRGIPRLDGRCDTGAFELNLPVYLPAVLK